MKRKLATLGLAMAATIGLLAGSPGHASALTYAQMWTYGGGWCVTVDTSVHAGSLVYLWPCKGQSNQHFAEGTYDNGNTIVFVSQLRDSAGRDLCLADPGDSDSQGVQWELWYCENITAEDLAISIQGGAGSNEIWYETGHGYENGMTLNIWGGGPYYDGQPIKTYHICSCHNEEWNGPGPN